MFTSPCRGSGFLLALRNEEHLLPASDTDTAADVTLAQTFVWVRQAKFGHVHSGQSRRPIWEFLRIGAKRQPPDSNPVAPTKPDGVSDGNWNQTDPKKGWNTILRLYSPLEPFFTKKWRPSEIELVK